MRKRRKNKVEFRKKMIESATKFEQMHELEGIEQCIDLVKQTLKLQVSNVNNTKVEQVLEK